MRDCMSLLSTSEHTMCRSLKAFAAFQAQHTFVNEAPALSTRAAAGSVRKV